MRRELSQSMLAELVHISVPYLSHIENGSKKVSLDVLVQVAEVLHVSLDELLKGSVETKAYGSNRLLGLLTDCQADERAIVEATVIALLGALRKSRK